MKYQADMKKNVNLFISQLKNKIFNKGYADLVGKLLNMTLAEFSTKFK